MLLDQLTRDAGNKWLIAPVGVVFSAVRVTWYMCQRSGHYLLPRHALPLGRTGNAALSKRFTVVHTVITQHAMECVSVIAVLLLHVALGLINFGVLNLRLSVSESKTHTTEIVCVVIYFGLPLRIAD